MRLTEQRSAITVLRDDAGGKSAAGDAVCIAAAFYHYEKQNLHGSRTLLGKVMKRLAPYPDAYLGVDVARLRAVPAAARSSPPGA